MLGLMQDSPLLVSALLEHAEREHGAAQMVSRRGDGRVVRQSFTQFGGRSRRLAAALIGLGVQPGTRLATLAWNSDRHMEIYFAASGIGAVCHTINPRLSDDQLAFIVNDAADQILFIDADLAPLVDRALSGCDSLQTVIVLCAEDELPAAPAGARNGPIAYETFIADAAPLTSWPRLDERAAAMLCYTSGTTGAPKGVLYSHRAIILHTLAIGGADALGLRAVDCVMPVVPMFHVMAWGAPYAAMATGFKLVLPGNRLDGASLNDLILAEGVTVAAGVPTLWLGLARHLAESGEGVGDLKRIVNGGAALPPSLVEQFRDAHGVQVQHAWGMTECSPVAGINAPKAVEAAWPSPGYAAAQRKQGRPPFGIAVKTTGADGRELPRDGASVGDIKLKGPWVLSQYFNHPDLQVLDDHGWFTTGDLGTIDADGFLQITDRAKDAVKSGGEWISTLDLENVALAHPAVLEAAVVARPDPVWDERPLLICVLKPGATATEDDLLAFYDGKVAKWQIPDAVVFTDEMTRSATGKINKVELRRRFVVR